VAVVAAPPGLLLAHQGGWDEILFVLAPLLVFAGLLALARKRADQLPRDDAEPGDETAAHEQRDQV
jgi:predicted MFS family arabinose efflux permease